MAFQQYKQLIKNPFKFKLFLLWKLPAAWLAGATVTAFDERHAIVSIPYKWLTQNPFKSMYFASQAMAAELSTGLLASGHVYKRKPALSMLVTKLEAVFTKKANSRIYFTCNDGNLILNAIEKAIALKEPQQVTATSIGTNKAGEIISEFKIQWSFRVKDR